MALFKDIKCVIFDLDGTLFDAPYDWSEIKRALGVARRISYSGLLEKSGNRRAQKEVCNP